MALGFQARAARSFQLVEPMLPWMWLLLTAQPAPASEPIWWEADGAVVAALEGRDLHGWADELQTAPPPTEPRLLLERFDVLARAGRTDAARATLDAMGAVSPRDLAQVADFLIDRGARDLAAELLERFPEAHPGWGYVLVRALAEERGDAWAYAWLAARQADDASDPDAYWLHEHVRFRVDRGTAGPLVEALAHALRAGPSARGAELYLQAVERAGVDEHDPSWLGSLPALWTATEAHAVGTHLARLRPDAGIALLDRALALPWTEADQRAMELRTLSAAFDAEPRDHEADFRAQVRHAKLEALKRSGRAREAQALLEEISALYPDGIPPMTQLAGQVQAISGQRVVGGRIEAAEPARRDEVRYWTERARYHMGRDEPDEATAAWVEAVRLAVTADPEGPEASMAVRQYAGWLARSKGPEVAVALLLAHLADADPASPHASILVHGLNEHDRGLLDPSDPVLWRYLEGRATWAHAEERLLWHLAERAEAGPDRDAVWTAAERLARGADPTRARVTGWAMSRTQADRRAVPVLEDAVARSSSEEHTRAAFTLFEVFLHLEDWRGAERLWPEAKQQLTAREQPGWLGQVALAAARSGAADDAVRLWAQRVNLDAADLAGLEALAEAGMRERLLAFYEELAHRSPGSDTPARARAVLARGM